MWERGGCGDDLQQLLHGLLLNAEKFNMVMSMEKIKHMCITKQPIRYMLKLTKNNY